MAVMECTYYHHHNDDYKYQLLTISLPIECMPENFPFGRYSALHVELDEVIEIFNVGNVIFNEKDEFLAIYKREDENQIYAIPVDTFFGHTDAGIKRFVEVDDSKGE